MPYCLPRLAAKPGVLIRSQLFGKRDAIPEVGLSPPRSRVTSAWGSSRKEGYLGAMQLPDRVDPCVHHRAYTARS